MPSFPSVLNHLGGFMSLRIVFEVQLGASAMNLIAALVQLLNRLL